MFIKNGSFRKMTHIISYVSPTILVQPESVSKSFGENHVFKIKVRGSRPLTYQWYKNDYPLINQTNNELAINNINSSDQAFYYCKIKNNGYYLNTNIVELSVINSPFIVSQPQSILSAFGSNILLEVSAIGTEPLIYKWYKNNIEYADSNTNKLYIYNISYENLGNYYVVISNQLGSVTSLSASVNAIEPITIITQPSNTRVNIFNDVQISLSCTGNFPISSQWRKNNISYGILSSNNNGFINLNLSNVSLFDAGYYDCILTNLVDSVTSEKIYVQIDEKPVFTLNPLSSIRTLSESVTFTVDTSGSDPITYQWIKIGSGEILNEISKEYTITNLKLEDEAEYACIATNLVGSTTSLYAKLSVLEIPVILADDNPFEFLMLGENIFWSS